MIHIVLETKKLFFQALVLTATAVVLLVFLVLSRLFRSHLKLFTICLQAIGQIVAFLVLLVGVEPTTLLILNELRGEQPPGIGKT